MQGAGWVELCFQFLAWDTFPRQGRKARACAMVGVNRVQPCAVRRTGLQSNSDTREGEPIGNASAVGKPSYSPGSY